MLKLMNRFVDEILQKMILPTDLLHSYPVTVKK